MNTLYGTKNNRSLKTLESQIRFLSPQKVLENRREALSRQQAALFTGIQGLMSRRTAEYTSSVDMLEALSPLKVLTRGYSITFLEGKPLTNAADAAPGKMLETKLNHGKIISEVVKIDEQP